MIFESPGRYPTIEELVLCDLFRNIDLREMRGPGISVSDVMVIWFLWFMLMVTEFSNSHSNLVLVHRR